MKKIHSLPATVFRAFRFTAAATLLLLPALWAVAAEPRSLNETMSDIGSEILRIYPMILQQRPFDGKQKQILRDSLPRLEGLFREAAPHIERKASTYQISYRYLLEHLQRTTRATRRNDFDFVRSQLYELGTICSSCHTQDQRLRSLFARVGADQFVDAFSYAEFGFFTRNYSQAVEYYDRYLRQGRPATEWNLVRPLQRLVTIYAQIYNNPKLGAKKLATYLDLPGHTDPTRKQLRGWIRGLKALDKAGVAGKGLPDFAGIEQEVGHYLDRELKHPGHTSATAEEEVQRIWLRGQLYRYLATVRDEEQIPKLLYWLALSNRAIGYEYYFSLADLYLKECVMSWPQHPWARKCYVEYRTYVDHAYGGSGGDFIPEEVAQELAAMSKALRAK